MWLFVFWLANWNVKIQESIQRGWKHFITSLFCVQASTKVAVDRGRCSVHKNGSTQHGSSSAENNYASPAQWSPLLPQCLRFNSVDTSSDLIPHREVTFQQKPFFSLQGKIWFICFFQKLFEWWMCRVSHSSTETGNQSLRQVPTTTEI